LIYDTLGLVGVCMVVYSYFLLQTEKITIKDVTYSIMNAAGSILIIVSLIFNFNLPSLVIESFWVLISFIGIFRHLNERHK